MKFKIKKFVCKGLTVCMILSLISVSAVSAENINKESLVEQEQLAEGEDIMLLDTNVYIVGDSTACEYGIDENYAVPRAGWGMYLSDFLIGKANVIDIALAGRSSKSFTTEKEYQTLSDNLKEGDYLIIQFGHNDEKNKNEEDIKNRYTDPEGDINTEGSFKNSLYERYIKLAQDRGAIPILVSPVSRRGFDENNKVKDSHGLYDDAVRELAEELDIPFVDMTELTAELYEKVGNEKAAEFHALYYDRTKGANGVDNTHYSHYGAKRIAMLFADNLVKNDIFLGKYRNDEKNDGSENSETMTRGDFVAMLVRLIDSPSTSENAGEKSVFPDVSSDNENKPYIALAKDYGITNGDKYGNFNPHDNMTAEEMITFVSRAIKYFEKLADTNGVINGNKVENLNFDPDEIEKPDDIDYDVFKETVQSYAIESAKYLGKYGFSFVNSVLTSPDKKITKSMAIDALYEIYSFITEGLVNDSQEAQSIEELEKVENTK